MRKTGTYRYFNSRPHEEVDNSKTATADMQSISTHDLTKRSTARNIYEYVNGGISTHDLTKRSTLDIITAFAAGTFQLTTSRRGRLRQYLRSRSRQHFNSRPHEEVDQQNLAIETARILFQLTTSRRGRPARRRTNGIRKNFNSRPHEEVDR